jgi:hypothetical protein
MASFTFSRSGSTIVVAATDYNTLSYPFAAFNEISRSATIISVEFAFISYGINPALDTVILNGTTYLPGSQTVASLYNLLYASVVFQLNYLLSTGNNLNMSTLPIRNDAVFIQVDYTGLVATNVALQIFVSATEFGTYSQKGSDILLPAAGRVSMNTLISGLQFQYMQLRLLVPTAATAGTITTLFTKQSL